MSCNATLHIETYAHGWHACRRPGLHASPPVAPAPRPPTPKGLGPHKRLTARSRSLSKVVTSCRKVVPSSPAIVFQAVLSAISTVAACVGIHTAHTACASCFARWETGSRLHDTCLPAHVERARRPALCSHGQAIPLGQAIQCRLSAGLAGHESLKDTVACAPGRSGCRGGARRRHPRAGGPACHNTTKKHCFFRPSTQYNNTVVCVCQEGYVCAAAAGSARP